MSLLLFFPAGASQNGAASLSANGTITASAQCVHNSASSPSGSGAVTTTSQVEHRAASSPSGSSALAVAALVDHRASAPLSATSDLAATARQTLSASAPLDGNGDLTASALMLRSASAILSGQGTLSGTADLTNSSAAALVASGALSATVLVVHGAMASLSGSATLTMVTTVEMHPRGLMVSELHTDFHANAIYSATVAGSVLSGSLHVAETLVLGVFDQNYTLLRVVTTDERRLDAQGGILSEVAVDWSEAISAETDTNLIHVHDPEHGATDIDLRPLSVDRTIKGTDVSLSLDGDHQTLRVTDEQIVVV